MAYIKQGDAYDLPVTIQKDGNDLLPSQVSKIEFTLCHVRKVYPDVGSYDSGAKQYLIPLTQAETFSLKAVSGQDKIPLDIRIKTTGNQVYGLPEPVMVDLATAISRTEL